MGQIVGLKAKPKRCNLNKLSQLGTPAAGEYILVSYDNSMTANGQGNFDRYIMGDGRTAAAELELKYLDDSTHPYIVEEVNKAVADIQPIEITGDVTNAPDEEDLTSEKQGNTDVLKFKDKAYNAALYSGLGRVYLRKNIVTLEGTGKNVLTQAMVNTANTIYHIQYNYDLNGQTITLPAGCVLEFEGGSLVNGTIVGNKTLISAGCVKIFDGITISGTWIEQDVFIEWYGAKGDGNVDDSDAFQATIDNFYMCNIVLQACTYKLTKTITYSNSDGSQKSGLKIEGKGTRSTIVKSSANIVMYFSEVTDMVLRDFRVLGNNKENIGIKIGESAAHPAVRCLLENISVYSCSTGIIANGWLNQFNSVQVRFNTIGFDNITTQATFVNLIAEGNTSCGIKSVGIASFYGGTIEGNGTSLEYCGMLNNGEALIYGVYFEANGPADSNTENIDSITGKQTVGAHIKCGFTDAKASAKLVVCGCRFSTGYYTKQRNAVDLDKCRYATFEASDEILVTSTSNTGYFCKKPGIIEYNNLELFANSNIAYSAIQVGQDINDGALFESHYFKNVTKSTNSVFPTSAHYDYYPLTHDGGVALRLSSGSAKSRIYSQSDNGMIVVSGTSNNSNIQAGLFVSLDYARRMFDEGVKSLTFSLSFKGKKNVSNAYTTVLITTLSASQGGTYVGKGLTTKTSTIDYMDGVAHNIYLGIRLDEIFAYLEDYPNATGGLLFEFQQRSNRIHENDIEAEYAKAHLEILDVCLFGNNSSYKALTRQEPTREYEFIGNINPSSIVLPNEESHVPIDENYIIFNSDDSLVVKNKTKTQHVQKILTSTPSAPVVGMMRFDTTLKNSLWWNGTAWVDSDGYTGARKRGSSTQMPTNLDITDAGFSYFNTDLMDSLIWDGNFFNIVLGNYMYKKYVELTPRKEVISWASSFSLNTRDVSYCDNAIVSVKAGTIISVRGHCSQFGALLSLVTTLADENDKHSVIQKYGNAQTNGIVVTAKPDKYIISAPEDCILVVNALNSSYTTPYGNTNNTPYEIILCSNTPFLESE